MGTVLYMPWPAAQYAAGAGRLQGGTWEVSQRLEVQEALDADVSGREAGTFMEAV
jgi:hypothetical protein